MPTPTAFRGKDVKVLMNSVDVSGDGRNVSFEQSADALDSTAYGDDARNYIPGLLDGQGSFEALDVSGAWAAGWDELLPGASATMVIYPTGDTPESLVTLQTSAETDDIIDASGHDFDDGDVVQFKALTGGTGLTTATSYYVVNSATDEFQVALTAGGAAINFTVDITAGTVSRMSARSLTFTAVMTGRQLAFPYDDLATVSASFQISGAVVEAYVIA